MIKSTYIHIPFCKKKCKYCSFCSFENLNLKNDYIHALLSEIDYFYDKTPQKTLYFGGGTPSLLEASDFSKIIGKFDFEPDYELTVELNPESTNPELLSALKNLGVNRLSFGAQSFLDNDLKNIGRLHNSKDIFKTLVCAKEIGFSNISVDLIYGLPNQTLEAWEENLRIVKNLDISHISLYGLKIERGSYFYKNPPKSLPNDDIQADMYLKAIEVLDNFLHYEVSNFAKNEEYMSKHNLNYWNGEKYWGFGLSASGFLDEGRYTNTKNIKEYIKNPLVLKNTEQINPLEERIFLGLRKIKGIDIEEINSEFNIDFEKKYKIPLQKYEKYFIKNGKMLSLNNEGILISNVILAEFLED